LPKPAFYSNFSDKVKLAEAGRLSAAKIIGYHQRQTAQGQHNMSDIDNITAALRQFRDERDWAQFHNPKDLAIALSIEAGELLELFLWKSAAAADQDKLKDELADVLAYAFMLADHYGLDVTEIMQAKLAKNKEKYPVEKAKGSAKKYNEL
jgi:NTP pyrophosphatase (non-canonical NTP hydrolase)